MKKKGNKTAIQNKGNRNCAFQYYNGRTVCIDKTALTLDEAKALWSEHYSDMVERVKEGEDVVVAIWINMKDEEDYRETLVYLSSPSVDEDGRLYEKIFYNNSLP